MEARHDHRCRRSYRVGKGHDRPGARRAFWLAGARHRAALPRGRLSDAAQPWRRRQGRRSEEHTSELQSLMRISYAVFCLKKKKSNKQTKQTTMKKHIID